jgi:hypothetical protein
MLRVDGKDIQDRVEEHFLVYDRLLPARPFVFHETTGPASKTDAAMIDEEDEEDNGSAILDDKPNRKKKELAWQHAFMEKLLILLSIATLVAFFIMILF